MKRVSRFCKLWIGVGLFTPIFFSEVGAEVGAEVVVSDDGKQIQLNGDGTWIQLSRDRFATNAAGQRLRLKPDGTWTLVELVSSDAGAKTNVSTPIKAGADSTLFLAKVEILKRRIKRAKSVHAETNTIYSLQVINDGVHDIVFDRGVMKQLTARSSSGAVFPIVDVKFAKSTVAPGARVNITVTAQGSPTWFGVKTMILEIAANALGNSQQRILSKRMSDVERRSVDSL